MDGNIYYTFSKGPLQFADKDAVFSHLMDGQVLDAVAFCRNNDEFRIEARLIQNLYDLLRLNLRQMASSRSYFQGHPMPPHNSC